MPAEPLSTAHALIEQVMIYGHYTSLPDGGDGRRSCWGGVCRPGWVKGSAGPIYSCLRMGTHAKRSPEGEM